MYGELLSLQEKRLSTSTTEWNYASLSEWVPAIDVPLVKAVLIARAVRTTNSSNMSFRFVYQTAATRTDKPSDWQLLGSTDMTVSNGNELVQCTGEISNVNVAEKFFIRFGVAYHAASNEEASACVSVRVAYDAPGQVFGKKSFQARAFGNDDYFEPVTGWFPVLRATNFKYAVIVAAMEGTGFQWRPAYQMAEREPEDAGSWTTTWGSLNTSGKGESVQGSLQSSGTGDYMWMRLGLQYTRSAAGFVEASVSVAVMGWR